MDPNAALGRVRYLTGKINSPGVRTEDLATLAEDLAEVFQGLDEWLSGGGFRPDAWQ